MAKSEREEIALTIFYAVKLVVLLGMIGWCVAIYFKQSAIMADQDRLLAKQKRILRRMHDAD